jgi:CheY-like chemotaxis protein
MSCDMERIKKRRSDLVLALNDPARRDALCRLLRERGWNVHVAGSGPEARRLARRASSSIVILDTQLPEESGWLTCAKIALADTAQRVPRVILVQHGEDAAGEQRAQAVGAAALVDGDVALIEELELQGAPPEIRRHLVPSEPQT